MSTEYKYSASFVVRRFHLFAFVFLFFMSLACSMLVPQDTSTKARPTEWSGTLQAVFIGQDGEDYAGKLCSAGTKKDNVHIHLSGIRTDQEPVAFRVEDAAQGGVWATPCDPVSNWFLYVKPAVNGETDVYFKPFREAPDGTEYTVIVSYPDGVKQMAVIEGSHVKP